MRKGFTLIELLVVIAIIAILGSYFLPRLCRRQEQGPASACLNNLKQIMMAEQMYCSDNDANLQPNCIGWYDYLYKYIQNDQVFFCPSESLVYVMNWPYGPIQPTGDYVNPGYADPEVFWWAGSYPGTPETYAGYSQWAPETWGKGMPWTISRHPPTSACSWTPALHMGCGSVEAGEQEWQYLLVGRYQRRLGVPLTMENPPCAGNEGKP